MKKTLLILLAALCVAWIAWIVIAQHFPYLIGNFLFGKENLVQKIANSVVSRDKNPQVFNQGLKDEGMVYQRRFYTDFQEIYDIKVFVLKKDGRRTLDIGLYFTNQNFSGLKTPSDVIAHQLIWGQPKIYEEIHMCDRNIDDMQVNIYQSFKKERTGGALNGFSREERDLGEKAGVREILFHDGKWMHEKKYLDAKPEEVQDIQREYLHCLSRIAKHFNIINSGVLR